MAGTAGALRVRRSAMLLRIQQARESRHRRAVARAQQAREAAVAAEALARQRKEAFGRARERRMREAHQALRGRVVDVAALEALMRLDTRLGAAEAGLDDTLLATQQAVVQQEVGVRTALADLRDASRTTVRRERLVETLQRTLDRANAVLEDVERDDQVSERWAACASSR